MELTLRRLIEQGIIARRGNLAWVREALTCGGRPDMGGKVAAVAGDAIEDHAKVWPANLHGRRAPDGQQRPGDLVRFLTGVAAGDEHEILSVDWRTLRVVGDVDLVVAGVAVGDSYEIFPAEIARAAAWLAKTAIHVVTEWPADHALLPYYAVLQTSDAEQGAPVGRHRRFVPGSPTPEGPISEELTSRWDVAYSVSATGRTADEARWLGALFAHLYREMSPHLDTAFALSSLRASGTGVQRADIQEQPGPMYAVEYTLRGTIEKYALTRTEWVLQDADAPAVSVTAGRVSLR